MRYKWSGKNSICGVFTLLSIFILFFGCDNSSSHPGSGFYSYRGYRDWWRIPLKYPYQIMIIDTFDCGWLAKHDPSQNIADPNVSSTTVIYDDIIMIYPAEEYLAFHCQNGKYGILIYQSEEIKFFESKTALQEYITQTFPKESMLQFQTLQQSYDKIWKHLSDKPKL